MELGILLATVVLFALVLATVAGFIAARVLLRAGETQGGGSDERRRARVRHGDVLEDTGITRRR